MKSTEHFADRIYDWLAGKQAYSQIELLKLVRDMTCVNTILNHNLWCNVETARPVVGEPVLPGVPRQIKAILKEMSL